MSPKISAETAACRRDDFLLLSQDLSAACCAPFVGKTVEVLLETQDAKHSFTGYTKQYFRVHIEPQEQYNQGAEVKVYIESFADGELFGKLL